MCFYHSVAINIEIDLLEVLDPFMLKFVLNWLIGLCLHVRSTDVLLVASTKSKGNKAHGS